jgi:8-oxo-dGTP pyrophosphatase MutT (NUDIX family)
MHIKIYLDKQPAFIANQDQKEVTFQIIRAAGGLVFNDKGEALFIFRRGKWDLPKGKLDEGESLEQCAVREVQEETGLKNVVLKEFIITTYHTYEEEGKQVLKESHWYRMEVKGKQELIPQTEEDITDIRWVKKEGWTGLMENSFPLIKKVLKKTSGA